MLEAYDTRLNSELLDTSLVAGANRCAQTLKIAGSIEVPRPLIILLLILLLVDVEA